MVTKKIGNIELNVVRGIDMETTLQEQGISIESVEFMGTPGIIIRNWFRSKTDPRISAITSAMHPDKAEALAKMILDEVEIIRKRYGGNVPEDKSGFVVIDEMVKKLGDDDAIGNKSKKTLRSR
jgi:hypothetical protein